MLININNNSPSKQNATTVHINNLKISAIVDSGASATLLSKFLADKLKLKIKLSSPNVYRS